jgi:flagellum-specific peptidoglycan hydrolase FlgJ
MAKRGGIPWWVWAGAGGLALVALGGGTVVAQIHSTNEFITGLWNAMAGIGLSNESKAILIGQAAYESGWGKGDGAVYGNNVFNVTAGPDWRGPTVGGGDTECDPITGLICHKITQSWRKYGSLEEAMRDMLSFLRDQNGGRYATAYQYLLDGDAVAYITELRARGYFTANASAYASAVASIQQDVLSQVG